VSIQLSPRIDGSVALEEFARGLTAARGASGLAVPDRVEVLFQQDASLWQNINAALLRDVRQFDKLLLRIHLKQTQVSSPGQRAALQRFLLAGYVHSKDVRYLNEYLWLGKGPDQRWDQLASLTFSRALLRAVPFHENPLISRGEAAAAWRHMQEQQSPDMPPDGPQSRTSIHKLALLGLPFRLEKLRRATSNMGIQADIWHFPDVDRRPAARFLKSSRLAVTVLSLLRGGYARFSMARGRSGDSTLGMELEGRQYDLAIHRLNCIIRRPLISRFRLGILNDHLGLLPWMRGRSTLEYSLLFGFPLGATVHLIDEGVDTGPIVRWYPAPQRVQQAPSIRAIKEALLGASDKRLLAAVEVLESASVNLRPNPPDAGLQYYLMHPELVRYVEHHILSGGGYSPSEVSI
jgi:hypothetical protein